MRPFFSYYGGKWRIAKHYPQPAYPLVIEPFAGAAGYSTWYDAPQAFLCDLNTGISGLWQWLTRVTPDAVRALPDVGDQDFIGDLGVCSAAETFIGYWCGIGSHHPAKRPWASMRKYRARNPNSFWGAGVRDRTAAQVSQIRDWHAVCTTYRNLPDVEATWFIDPPYAGAPGSHYTCGSDGIDYADLADFCRTRRGQVIVCEAQGADWLPFHALGAFKGNESGKVRGKTLEAVWLNAGTDSRRPLHSSLAYRGDTR